MKKSQVNWKHRKWHNENLENYQPYAKVTASKEAEIEDESDPHVLLLEPADKKDVSKGKLNQK